jgi:cytoskeletal protein RodZ
MQTVGQLLKKTREVKGLDLAKVEKFTKIRHIYLEALEKDDYRILPSAIAAKGFIKNYGQLLGLPNETLQALFRRDFAESETGQVIPRGMVTPLDKPDTISWTPKRTVILVVLTIFLLLGAYLFRQVTLLRASPLLAITNPVPNQISQTHIVTVSGRTNPDITIFVNQQLAEVDRDGTFETSIDLPSGKNLITVTATSKFNRSTKKTITVFVNN